jgi:hypothetical protein
MNHIDKLKSKLSSIKSNVRLRAKPFTEVKQTQVEKIYKFDLSSEIDANEVVNLIYKFRETVPYSNAGKTNVFAWHSNYDTHIKTSDFDPLIKIIQEKLNSVGPTYQIPRYVATYPIADSWVGIYNKTEYTVPHEHSITHYAAVYYAKAEEDCSPIVFKNSKKDLEIVPTTNTLLIFSGRAWHYVPKSTSDHERIFFAANFVTSFSQK